MFKERALIFAIAAVTGLLLCVGLFYLYQKTKVVEPSKTRQEQISSAPALSFFLTIDSPEDEEVFDKAIVPLSGKTTSDAQVIISLEDKDLALTPAADGSFWANLSLRPGVNLVEIIAINEGSQMISEKRTITYTAESF